MSSVWWPHALLAGSLLFLQVADHLDPMYMYIWNKNYKIEYNIFYLEKYLSNPNLIVRGFSKDSLTDHFAGSLGFRIIVKELRDQVLITVNEMLNNKKIIIITSTGALGRFPLTWNKWRIGYPALRIRMVSIIPEYLNWRTQSSLSISSGLFVSFGLMQRTKKGWHASRVFINASSDCLNCRPSVGAFFLVSDV